MIQTEGLLSFSMRMAISIAKNNMPVKLPTHKRWGF
jgi:hypothetical protein